MLDDAGWRSFTTIEVPEFEGYSSGKLPGLLCNAYAWLALSSRIHLSLLEVVRLIGLHGA